MVILHLDRTKDIPLFKQVLSQLIDLIEKNVLTPGSRLPSTRSLADNLGIHRSTVYKAYEELWALGYLESRPGSYSIVREKQFPVTTEHSDASESINWDKISSPQSQQIYHLYRDMRYRWMEEISDTVIDFSSLELDQRLFPIDEFRKCTNRAFADHGSELLMYGTCEGYRPLREYIAKRLSVHSVSITWEEVLITNGAQNGFDLIMRLISKPGQRVFVESPTYAMILPLLSYYHAEVVGIPMEEDGISLTCLEEKLQEEKPSLIYTIPNFQNPTGITMTQARREELLSLCEKYQIPLVEDAFEEEMKYFGKVPLPIKSMDRRQIVLYLGTFSKVLFPGIRIGWIAAGKECIDRLAALKRFSDLSSSTPIQAALAEFCLQGGYDYHIKRMHRIYRKRMQCAIEALKSHVVHEKVSWHEPNGGYLIWVELDDIHLDEKELNTFFIDRGIRVTLGMVFFPEKPAKKYFRLSIATLNEDEITEGIRRFGLAVSELYSVKVRH